MDRTLGVPLQAYPVCGIRIAAASPEQAARLIVDLAITGQGAQVHLCNAFTLSLVERDPNLAMALETADLNLADGAPVAWLGRRTGMRGPVRGPQLVDDVALLGIEHDLPHFFLGGAEGVAERAADALALRHPGMRTVGTVSPPFGDPTPDLFDWLAEEVRKSGAKIVWVALGTPKQDLAVPPLAQRLPGVVVVPVGAAFNFWAGTTPMAPVWLHGTGLEWAHRLLHEPRRLWRRYLLGNPRFVWKVLKDSLSRNLVRDSGA